MHLLNIEKYIKVRRLYPFNTKLLRIPNCKTKVGMEYIDARGCNRNEVRSSNYNELEKTRYGDWEKRGRCIDF